MRRLLRTWVWPVLAAGLAGCLPTALTNAEIAARIADATGSPNGPGTADGTISPDGTAPPICGNKTLEESEQCDDGDTNVCNGCDACELRRVLHVADASQFLVASSPTFDFLNNGTLKTKGDQVSFAVWLKLAALPPVGKPASVVGLGTEKGDAAFLMSVATSGNNAYAACTMRSPVLDKTVLSPVILQPGQWHHLRCTIAVDKVAPTGQLRAYLSVDGASPKDEAMPLPAMAFKTTQLALGAFPASQQTSTLQGWLDELHLSAGTDPKLRQTVLYRVPTNQAGLLLYHMDIRSGDKLLRDAAAGNVNALQTTPGVGQAGVELKYAADDCYGHPDVKCTANNKQAPWCP